jgi:hypothetical protein
MQIAKTKAINVAREPVCQNANLLDRNCRQYEVAFAARSFSASSRAALDGRSIAV